MRISQRITISLPADLFAQGEVERRRRKVSRSAYVAQLYRQHLEACEIEARVARYAAAYKSHPQDEAEDAVTAASIDALAIPESNA